MKNFDEYEMAGKTVEDEMLIANALENDKQLFVDGYGRVLDVDGNYIADYVEQAY